MGVYMRAVLRAWDEPDFAEPEAFAERGSPYRVRSAGGRGWAEFEAVDESGEPVMAADVTTVHEQSVAAANVVVGYLEQRPGVLVQVDTVGWYSGPELILRDPGETA